MPPFKDEHVLIIAPGSQTTLAQLGLPESYTPARLRVKTRMFPAEKAGEWEPLKVREKKVVKDAAPNQDGEVNGTEEEVQYEEDPTTDEGAVYPLRDGRVVNWSCFYALLTHVYNTLSPPFHTPILIIAQPAWTQQDQESLTQFFFEKFKTPAFALMDSAHATLYAYSLGTATVVDVGYSKVDVTAVADFVTNDTGRGVALPGCGGEDMTNSLAKLLGPKGFTRDMAEQLKKNPICEVLPPGTPLPTETTDTQPPANPAAAASTGVNKSGPNAATQQNGLPRGPGPGTEAGEEDDAAKDAEDEGVLDVASIVTSGKASEIIAKKEREKAEKAAARKGAEAAAGAKMTKLPNSQRAKAILHFDERRSTEELEANIRRVNGVEENGEVKPVDGAAPAGEMVDSVQAQKEERKRIRDTSLFVKKEIEVGTERFQAVDEAMMGHIADAIHRCILSVPVEVNKRSELWDSLIVLGNGSKVKGFKDALVATLNAKYLISPSSATIFTSELPSNFSTPIPTGANTPQPQAAPTGNHGPGVNPLLLAATTASNPTLVPPQMQTQFQQQQQHSGHGQTPTSIKLAKMAEYFSEWKDVGFEEAHFLGAQVAAKIIFIIDQGLSKGFMSRTEYNDLGPQGIHEFSFS